MSSLSVYILWPINYKAKLAVEKNCRSMLVKLMPAVNFINVKCVRFSYTSHFGSFFLVTCTKKKLPKRHLYEKLVRLTLMELTTGLGWPYICAKELVKLAPVIQSQSFTWSPIRTGMCPTCRQSMRVKEDLECAIVVDVKMSCRQKVETSINRFLNFQAVLKKCGNFHDILYKCFKRDCLLDLVMRSTLLALDLATKKVFIYERVWTCLCVWVRKRERERERLGWRLVSEITWIYSSSTFDIRSHRQQKHRNICHYLKKYI